MNQRRTLQAVSSFLIIVLLGLSTQADAQRRKERKERQRQEMREGAQASTDIPVSTQVKLLSIPYDPNLPRFVITVEPFTYHAAGELAPVGVNQSSRTTTTTTASDGSQTTTVSQSTSGYGFGEGLAAQFVTALTRGGNMSVATLESVQKKSNGTYSTNLVDGEIGVFVVRGAVTEFTETAEASGKERHVRLGRLGAAIGIGGAIAGNRNVALGGGALAIANPSYDKQALKRTGMIGMDLQLIDGRTGRLLTSFTAKGSFTSITKAKGFTMFGIGGSSSEFAKSSLGQATRVAMNDALQKTADGLLRAPR